MDKRNRKNFFVCLIILLIIAGAVYYILQDKKIIKVPSDNIDIYKEGKVNIQVKDNTITNTSLTYKMLNETNEDMVFGVDYTIEIWEDNMWKKFGVEISWIAIANILNANSSYTETIDWANIYGKLSRGKYRIIKKVDSYILSDEFEIK